LLTKSGALVKFKLQNILR